MSGKTRKGLRDHTAGVGWLLWLTRGVIVCTGRAETSPPLPFSNEIHMTINDIQQEIQSSVQFDWHFELAPSRLIHKGSTIAIRNACDAVIYRPVADKVIEIYGTVGSVVSAGIGG